MSLYQEKDIEIFNKGIDKVIEESKRVREERGLLRTREEVDKIYDIVIKFVKQNRRKVYGGFALNMILKEKNKKDALYPDDELPDIDVYSPEPIKDLYKVCNLIFDAGYKDVVGKEGVHSGTYKIFAGKINVLDVSYVPRNIYNKLPFKEIEGYTVIHPHFMSIDYLRMFTDPLDSYWRLSDKKIDPNGKDAFKRFVKLQSYYPFPHTENKLVVSDNNDNIEKLLRLTLRYTLNKETMMHIGTYAYNMFLMDSGILKSKKKEHKKFKIVNIPQYEIISTRYNEDALSLINEMKTQFPDMASDIKHIEHYPFYGYLGYHVCIYYKDRLITTIYHYNKRCTPYLTETAYDFVEDGHSKVSGKLRMGTFYVSALYTLVQAMKGRVDDDEKKKNYYYAMLSHMVEMRNYFYETSGKTIFDKTIFVDFVVECMGEQMSSEQEHQKRIEKNKKLGKALIFKYDPAVKKKEKDAYFFPNSSGNPITNPKNLKLTGKVVKDEEDDEDDIINEDETSDEKDTVSTISTEVSE